MKAFLTTTALAAVFAVGTFASIPARAQDNQPCVGEQCPGGGKGGPAPEQMMPKKRMNVPEQNNQNNQMQGGQKMPQGSQTGDQTNDQVIPRKKRAQNAQPNDNNANMNNRRVGENRKWRYDPSKERRRSHKDATYRFYFGGFWYPEPYWTYYGSYNGPVPGYRISCGEGRSIVAQRYNRVRVLECNGGTYAYIGRRAGDNYRVLVNARTGRIVGRDLI